ncbi:hypothetical protein ABIA39_004452 [Nocardia sp. GAS34]|uniref:hypothetical protein n=1 Tax=unclassified Nocardia TaxID=2637762 RepID=UPI003D1C764C
MSADDISIKPADVAKIGGRLKDLASQAITDTNKFFDSQATAAKNNPGFTTGQALIDFSTKLHGEINGFITALSTNAEQIVQGAQNYPASDDDTAGLIREIGALNGLTQPVLPGR